MILVDFNQVVLSNIMASYKKEASKESPENKNLLKHMILATLLSYKQKFGKEYGQLVIAADNRNYWRREKFPLYKGHRKRDREASDLNWPFIFEVLDEIKSDIIQHFPYKVLDVHGAEADDVIACLVKHLQENELVREGLFDGEAQKIMIVSSDTDFCQLQKYHGVKQWSPMQKKMVTLKVPLSEFVMEHICTGDTGDGVPNICSADNCIFDKIRQKPFMKDRLPEFINKGIDACKDETEKARFQRNQMLVDFEFIPKVVHDAVIKEYNDQQISGSKTKVFNYLIKNRMKLLLDSAGDF